MNMHLAAAGSAAVLLVLASADLSAQTSKPASESPASRTDDAAAPTIGEKIAPERVRALIEARGGEDTGLQIMLEHAEQLPPDVADRFTEHFDVEAVDRELAAVYIEHMPAKAGESAIAFLTSADGQDWLAVKSDAGRGLSFEMSQLVPQIVMALMSGDEPPPADPIATPEPGSARELVHRILELTRARAKIEAQTAGLVTKLRRDPRLPEGMADPLAAELTADRVLSMLIPQIEDRADEATLRAVVDWASTPAARAYQAALLAIQPEVERISDEACAAAEKAADGS